MAKEILSPWERVESPLSRRTYTRLSTKLKIDYRLTGDLSKSVKELIQSSHAEAELERSSSTRDVSASGVLFYLDKPLPLGGILEIEIEIPAQEDKPIECLSKVERVDEMMKNKIYGIGIRFLDMSPADHVRIDNYLKDIMRERSIV